MVTTKEILSQMKTQGWSLNEESVEGLLDGARYSMDQACREIMNYDLKEIGSPILPDIHKAKSNTIATPVVLQVSKVRNVAAPKAFEESGAAPRLLRISLTDGFTTIHGLEVQNIKPLSLNTAPGTKICLKGRVPISTGFVLLTTNNVSVVGGTVQELFDKWKLSSSVSKYNYNRIVRATDGSGPPAWVPFGKRIEKKEDVRHFKALKDAATKEKEDDEFENQRKQAVRELAKEGQGKIFGGGKQMLDATVQKVINAGFSQEVAEWALRHNKNDPVKAIRELKASASGQPIPNDNNYNNRNSEGGRGRGRGRGRGKGGGGGGSGGAGGGGPDGSDDDYDPPPNMPRPSGPASLFDFFDSKIIEKKETVKFAEPVPDVRGASYQQGRGGGRGSRGKRGRGRNEAANSSVNGSISPPNLTMENWPAPGEEKPAPSNRTYLESREIMEEKEQQEHASMARTQQSRSAGREYQPPAYRNGYGGQQYYGRENGDYSGGRQDYGGGNQRDYYYQDNRGRGGDRGGRRGSRGGGFGGYGGNSYRGGDSDNYRYNDSGRGGRGGGNSGPRRDNNYSGNNYYRDYNTNYRGSEGTTSTSNDSGYRGNASGDSGYRGNASGRGESNHYDAKYNSYSNNRQQSGRGRIDSRGRGMQERTPREMELIKDFQNSMTVSGHYQNLADGYGGSSHSRYRDSDYSQFSGTLEFHRGGGRRGGRGGYN